MQPSETELATLRARLAEAEEVMRQLVAVADTWHWRDKAGLSLNSHPLIDDARAFIAQGEGKGEPDFRAPVGSDQLVVHASNSPTRGCTLEVDNPRKEVMPDADKPVEPPAGAFRFSITPGTGNVVTINAPDYRAIAARLMEALNLYEEKHIPGQYQFCGHWPGYAELHPSCYCTGSTGCKRIPSALAAARAAGIGGE